jgi:quinolinate synthase
MSLSDAGKIAARIQELKARRKAVILAHNYQLGEVQDIADFTGDSLELSVKAAKTDAELIVFAGVLFMAETAKILSPSKTVLLPVLESGCPMADMAGAEELRELKAKHPGAIVVTYVNSTAAVKAESDICVTSANSVKIVSALPKDKPVIFVPDRNLGAYTALKAGREMILWPGFCPTHMRIAETQLKAAREDFPDAVLIAHPECRPEVSALADAVLSTGGMIKFVKESHAKRFIVATEMGIIHRLRKENPDKRFFPVSEQAVCPNMKMIRLEHVLEALERDEHKIEVDPAIIDRARIPIERMIEMSK